jgi:CheY-like chemotaxis protein/HPt (histidine-containing phosphotransfer) domain-containing protein
VDFDVRAEWCEGAALLRVEVSDTGIGIGESQRARLFEPFRQADASTTRTFGGTGLGLAIARRLVVALGGDIGVASELGEGSTFWFTGRFELAEAPGTGAGRDTVAAPADAHGGRRGHVLLVEDNDINQLVALGMLEAAGYTTDIAEDGEAAVRSAAANRYDAVLMDLRMPVMDGYAASRAIRAAEPRGRRVPIIAMTASAGEAERERCLAAGMDDFLAKPVSSVRLAAVLRAWVRRTPEAVVAGDTSPSEGPPALNPSRLDELRSMGERAVPLVDRALTNFVAGLPTALAGLRAAVRATDAHEVEALAHRLRGGALNLGAERLADCCLRVETAAQAGAVDEVSRLLGELDDAGAEAVEVLGAWRQAAA